MPHSARYLNQSLTYPTCQQVAEQLSQTDALLDKYANMLAKSETVTRLIFDERWGGADAVSCINIRYHTPCGIVTDLDTYQDEVTLVREREEALERARIERERQEAASREAEERAHREAEEAAQREAEERAKQEAAAVAKAPARGRGAGVVSSGVRGVRGTRATATAMASRGARGLSKTGTPRYPSLHPKFTGNYQRPRLHLPFIVQDQLAQPAALVAVEVGPGQALLQAGVQVYRGVFQGEAEMSLDPWHASKDLSAASFANPFGCTKLVIEWHLHVRYTAQGRASYSLKVGALDNNPWILRSH